MHVITNSGDEDKDSVGQVPLTIDLISATKVRLL